MALFRKLGWLAQRRRREDELREELEFHLEEEAEELEAGGQPLEQARAAARRSLGNLARVQEETRAAWGWTGIERLAQDLRYGMRTMRKSPGFLATSVLSLMLGIGASTAIFTVVNGVLLRPLPYPEPDRLVRLWETIPKRSISRNVVNAWNFLDWRDRTHSFEAIAAIDSPPLNLAGFGEPVALPGMLVSPAFFSILGVHPLIGRTFAADEATERNNPSAVLSYGLWQGRFGGDRGVLGRKILVNGQPAIVVGVMPRNFAAPGSRAELWMPLRLQRTRAFQGGRFLETIARLKPGITIQQADQDLKRVAGQLAQERAEADKNWSAEVVPLLHDTVQGVQPALLALLAAVGFLLLIACANVANLFLMRGAERASEVALREALGASRPRILQQFLTEGLIISLLAAAAGMAAGYLGLQAMLAMLPESEALPRMGSIGLDHRVFVFAVAVSALTTLVFGVAPIVSLERLDFQKRLRIRGRSGNRWLRRGFVSVQIALAVILLTGAGLMARSFSRLVSVNPGFALERRLALDIFQSPVTPDPRRRSEYFEKIVSEVRRVPGVEAASTVHILPLEHGMSGSCFTPPADPLPPPTAQSDAQFLVVGPGYFSTMGIPLENGREFTERDRHGAPSVIMVNRAFVQQYYPGENPIGKRLVVCWDLPDAAEIIGVAADARQTELEKAPAPTIFVPNLEAPSFFASVVIRTRADPGQVAKAVVGAIHRENPDQAVSKIRTLQQVFDDSVARPRFQFSLLVIFAGVAVFLAAIGVGGVVSYSVAQRTTEIGVRVAVGATRRDIAGLVLKEGLLLAAIGVAAGLAGALALTRFLKTLLYQINPNDSMALAAACGLLAAAALVAIIAPLRRATRVDPMTALRHE